MISRQRRLRREYLYRKSQEDQERRVHDRKEALKSGLANDNIPTELRKDALKLGTAIQYTDKEHEEVRDHEDDEYAWAGVEDPKLVITTSHDPSSRLKQFCKEMSILLPNCQRLNRGNAMIGELMDACRANRVTDLILLNEHRGEPDRMVICHLPHGPTASFTLSGAVLRHDIKDRAKMSQVYPNLVFHQFTSKLGLRVKNILKYIFPVTPEDSKRILSFFNDDDHVSFRHHTFKEVSGQVELTEIGPRFEMKLYEIKRGTVEQQEAPMEWKLRPYLHTAKKRKHLTTED